MAKSKRVLLAGLFHETHTFLEGSTALADFQITSGDALLRLAGDSSPWGGVLEAAQRFGWTPLPTVDFRAAPGAVVENAVLGHFWREFQNQSRPHLDRGVDAIFLVLHGAMVSRSVADVEGDLMEKIRALPGAERLPVFGVVDLHANFTQQMASAANCLVAYRENPHTDARQTAQRAATLLDRCLETGRTPRTHWLHPPLIWPPTGTATASEPMLGLERLAAECESEDENLWAVNILAGFAYADTPDTGASFTVATTGGESAAREVLNSLARWAWERRELGNVIEPPAASVLPQILQPCAGLTVLVEPSDNIGAGAPGDGTGLLRLLLDHDLPRSAVAINDPEAVRRLKAVAPGRECELEIGGKGSRFDPGPVRLRVSLISKSDGRFRLEDRQSHLASMCGDEFEMGPCAVVRHRGLELLLTSRKTPPFDLGQWRSQGIEPAQLSFMVVKAAVAHRRAYDPIASRMIWVATPGPCSINLRNLPYTRVRRPAFPLDPIDARWEP